MSKIATSVRSRRMVRRNRAFFRLMDETGLAADELRRALETRDALERAAGEIAASMARIVRDFGDVVSEVGTTIAREMAPLLSAIEEMGGEDGE